MSGMVACARAEGESVSSRDFCRSHSACRPNTDGGPCNGSIGIDATACPELAEWVVVEEETRALLRSCTSCAVYLLADTAEGQDLLYGAGES